MQAASPGGYAGAGTVGSPAAVTGSAANVASYGGSNKPVNGGRFDFDDGGTYCGGWEDGKAHGHGVCTGPKGQGEYSGSWHFGFEVSGVYTWPSGSTFEGQWQNGKRHGLGTEYRGRWTYRGEWTQGFKGRYGVRQATASNAKYEGTWANGLQDGYGSETYADGGTYQGQWLRGLRHGYGVRTSAPFGMASHFRPKAPQGGGSMASLKSESAAEPTSERDRRLDDVRGGFVLKARSDEPPARRRSLVERSSNFKESILKGLKLRKQRSTGDLDKRGNTNSSIRSTGSSASWMSNDSAVTSGSHHTDSNASFVVEDEQMDASVTETYMGEWKNDKRSGFGISERSDGLKYEGEWYNNKKYGYGVTSFKDGTKEEGKYKNNVLITSQKKKHLFLIRSAKFRERIDAAVNAAQRASKIALQKADIAISRTATARGKGEQADISATQAREDSEIARIIAKQFAPDFPFSGTEGLRHHHRSASQQPPDLNKVPSSLNLSTTLQPSQQVGRGTKEDGNLMRNRQQQLQQQAINNSDYNNSRYNDDSQGGGHSMLSNHPSQQQAQNQQLQQLQLQQQQSNYPSTSSYSQIPNNNSSNPSQNIYNQNSSASAASMDRLDRNSLMNHPIDVNPIIHNNPQLHNQSFQQQQQQPSQVSYQQQQQQQQQQQSQPYMNRVGEMPSGGGGGGLYQNSGGSIRLSHQNLMDMSDGKSSGMRNSLLIDSSPHSQMMDSGGGGGGMASGGGGGGYPERGRDTLRRSQMSQGGRGVNNSSSNSNSYQTAMSDHFDHYKRPPSCSRDSSVDRFNNTRARSRPPRAQTPEVSLPNSSNINSSGNPHSRASSRHRTPFGVDSSLPTAGSMSALLRSGGGGGSNMALDNATAALQQQLGESQARLQGLRGETPGRNSGKDSPSGGVTQFNDKNSVMSGSSVFDENILRQRGLGQEIPPVPYTPKRTESLFLKPVNSGPQANKQPQQSNMTKIPGGGVPKRKKSLPDANSLPKATIAMSREEVAALGSARRQELHRMQDEAERLRANPLLYLLNPNIKNWFSRQKLMVLVLFINLSLAIMFLQLLT